MYNIALSVGHNKNSKGAVADNVNEFDIAKEWQYKISTYFDVDNYRIFLVPTGSIKTKVDYINDMHDQHGIDLAVEFHFNACGGCGAKGSEVVHYPFSRAGKIAAQCIQTEIVSQVGSRDRGVKEGWYQMNKASGVFIYFLKNTKCPSVIPEPEFLEHYDEIIKPNEEKYFKAISDGIKKYCESVK